MEEAVAEHLREEDAHAVLGELGDVRARTAQTLHVGNGHAVDALHDHDFQAAEVKVDVGHVEQVRAGEITLQLRGVGGLAHEVELVEYGFLVFRDDLERP